MPAIISSIHYYPGSHNQCYKARKEIKSTQIGKGELKLSLFVDDMAVHIESPKEPTVQILELIREFSKFTDFFLSFFFKDFIYLFLDGKGGRNRGRETFYPGFLDTLLFCVPFSSPSGFLSQPPLLVSAPTMLAVLRVLHKQFCGEHTSIVFYVHGTSRVCPTALSFLPWILSLT